MDTSFYKKWSIMKVVTLFEDMRRSLVLSKALLLCAFDKKKVGL